MIHLDKFAERPVIRCLSLFGKTASGQLFHIEMIMQALAAKSLCGTGIGAGALGEIPGLVLAGFHILSILFMKEIFSGFMRMINKAWQGDAGR